MSSLLFKDLGLTTDQVNSVYPLKQLKVLNDAVNERFPNSSVSGTNIVVGSNNLQTSNDVEVLNGVNNAIIIGNGQFQGDHPMVDGAVAIGNDITMPDPNATDLTGCLIFGDNFAAVGNGVTSVGGGSSTASIAVYYRGVLYYLPLFAAVNP